jgi:transposase
MDWRGKVELFEQIRREYEFGCGTIIGTAKRFGIHRRMVRQAIESALPPERKRVKRQRPLFDLVKDFISRILEADKAVRRKQRHTAHRIFERIRTELPAVQIAERTVQQYVRELREQKGLSEREVFIPQHYEWGAEAQVDWYEADVIVRGETKTLQFFCLRAMASGAAFHRAYEHATQQAFLEAHEKAFEYFGGTFRRLRYDNLKAAVKRILRGSRREETTRFIAFRSHYGFAASFCQPNHGNEKGGVEAEAGYFRRNHLVPVPSVSSVEELNRWLIEETRSDEQRRITGHQLSVGAGLIFEKQALRNLPAEAFDLAEDLFPMVNDQGCVRVKTNAYSTPLAPGTRVRVRIFPLFVEVWNENRLAARHERCYERGQERYQLEHYLDVLARKPGAFCGSKPLQQWREEGRWTREFDQLLDGLKRRHGESEGVRQMIELLREGRRTGYDNLRRSVETALSCGARSAEAVWYLMGKSYLERAASESSDLVLLDEIADELTAVQRAHFTRPLPQLSGYDELLSFGGAAAAQKGGVR